MNWKFVCKVNVIEFKAKNVVYKSCGEDKKEGEKCNI
jgi:hypothetical protein